MQLAEDTDAGGFDTGAELPPQAQTGLPGMAADLADIAPAPSAEQTLLQSAFGDRGAEQYQALRSAGQAGRGIVPAPTAGVDTPMGGPAGPSPRGISNLVGGTLMAVGGRDPLAGQKMHHMQQQEELRRQAEFRQNASEFYTALMPAAFKQFPGRPDLAASFLMNQARQRGLLVDPAVLMKLNQDIAEGKLTEKELDDVIGDPSTPVSTIERVGVHAKFADELAKGRAAARTAVAEANAITAAPGAVPTTVAEARAQAQLKRDTSVGARNVREQRFTAMAEQALTRENQEKGLPPPTPADVAQRAEELRLQFEGRGSEVRRTAGLVGEGRLQAARALQNLSTLEKLGARLLTKDPARAALVQPFEFLIKRIARDPGMAEMQAIPGTLSNLARGLGEKGVLTDTDLRRVERAVAPTKFDTWQTYSARLNFTRRMISEGQKALERAGTTGRIEAVDSSAVGTFEGDPYPPETAAAPPAPSAAPASSAPARVRTRADVEALPSGAPYINPSDGRVLYKR